MRFSVSAFLSAALVSTGALAGGIDRSGQDIGFIFQDGTYAEASVRGVFPSVSGNDFAAFGGGSSGNVAKNFFPVAFAFKMNVNDQLSFGLQYDQPYGADLLYAATSVALGGTTVSANTWAITGLARYKFTERFSLHGGARAQTGSANFLLTGAGYGGLSGYGVSIGQSTGFGYVVGAAYEVPEIALRFAVTYNSQITNSSTSTETGLTPVGITGTTQSVTPQSLNVDFQTGVAKNTLLLASIRWVDWSALSINPPTLAALTGRGLINVQDTITYGLGGAYRFNEMWAASGLLTYEGANDFNRSPLEPATGAFGISLAAIHTRGNVDITAGINYTFLGDANATTAIPVTAFRNNSSFGAGVKIGVHF